MVREGKAPAKAPTSVATGSTARNPSQPLNDTYSDIKCQNNARKLAATSPIFELPLMFSEAIQEEFQLFHRHNFRGLSTLILSPLYTSLCTEDCFSLSVGMRSCAPFCFRKQGWLGRSKENMQKQRFHKEAKMRRWKKEL
ncbi:hypothetical protein PIB30_103770, partial [Stylosanthes scabra]|nr:hypothetical protein [Stylosanthes scabra]